MTLRVMIGTLAVVLTIALLTWTAINEPARMEAFAAAQAGRSIENGALLFESNCASCHGKQGEGIPTVAPALNAPELFNGQRVREAQFAGSVRDFIKLTIAAGRPIPTQGSNYSARMPTWSQRFGGPLRDDQVDDLVNFVMNWGKAYEAAAATPVVTPTVAAFQPVGTDLNVQLPPGDAARGQALFNSQQPLADGKPAGCQGCHTGAAAGSIAPPIEGVATRAATRESGLSAEQYLHKSIVQPDAFIVPGFNPVMPKDLGQRMSAQDLADIIAYLMTLK